MRISESTCEALLFAVTLLILTSNPISATIDKESSKQKYQKLTATTPKSGRGVIDVQASNSTSLSSKLTTLLQPENSNSVRIVPPSKTVATNTSSLTVFPKPEDIVKYNTSDVINQITTKLLHTLSTIPQSEITLNSKSSYSSSTISLLEIFVNSASSSFASSTTTQIPQTSESQANVPFPVTANQESSKNFNIDLKSRQFKPTVIPYGHSTTTRISTSSSYAPINQKNDITMGYVKTSTRYSSISKPTVFQSDTDVLPSTTSDVKTSTVYADAVVFTNRKTTATGTSTSSPNGKTPPRPNTPSTTFVNVYWNGVNRTTSTTPYSISTLNTTVQNNSNTTTTQPNLIDFKEIITAPVTDCPKGQKFGPDGKCKEIY